MATGAELQALVDQAAAAQASVAVAEQALNAAWAAAVINGIVVVTALFGPLLGSRLAEARLEKRARDASLDAYRALEMVERETEAILVRWSRALNPDGIFMGSLLSASTRHPLEVARRRLLLVYERDPPHPGLEHIAAALLFLEEAIALLRAAEVHEVAAGNSQSEQKAARAAVAKIHSKLSLLTPRISPARFNAAKAAVQGATKAERSARRWALGNAREWLRDQEAI